MYGLGLVWGACHLILRFAARYYGDHRADYTSAQQAAIDALIEAAQGVDSAVASIFAPLP